MSTYQDREQTQEEVERIVQAREWYVEKLVRLEVLRVDVLSICRDQKPRAMARHKRIASERVQRRRGFPQARSSEE